MFDIQIAENEEVLLSGRFDASQVEKAEAVFDTIENTCTINCRDLDYISSAGIGVIIATYKRLHGQGATLKLIKLNPHIIQVFRYAGLTKIFDVE
jgi:anti-anti-sigma factor